MFEAVLSRLGFARNEAKVYETLLREGDSSAGHIAIKSGVHRRNVYDTVQRLVEKGAVYAIVGTREISYQAVAPDKLLSVLDEKKQQLSDIMPALQEMHQAGYRRHEVYVYRGPEGWKNYMRDHLRISQTAYYISAKGAWLDERVKGFFPLFEKEARKLKLEYYHLFDHRVRTQCPEVLKYVGPHYKFLPRDYSGPSSIDIFGDHVNLLADIDIGRMGDEIRFTVIVNKALAEAFRTWFRYLWSICPDFNKTTTKRLTRTKNKNR